MTMLSSDDAPPYDRPNCSKDYLAGNAPEDWMPLRPPNIYKEQRHRSSARTEVDRNRCRKRGRCAGQRRSLPFDSCCSPPAPSRFASISRRTICRMSMSCARSPTRARSSPRRSGAGAPSSSAQASSGSRLRPRCGRASIEVHVVAPEQRPLERVLGPRIWRFHPRTPRGARRRLPSGGDRNGNRGEERQAQRRGTLPADLVVVGIGVRPRIELAEQRGS